MRETGYALIKSEQIINVMSVEGTLILVVETSTSRGGLVVTDVGKVFSLLLFCICSICLLLFT